VAAAKALNWHHEVWRWVVAAPPIVASALLAIHAHRHARAYADAMERGDPLPDRRWPRAVALALAVYAVIALIAAAVDG
jgi:uncharacterized membrane protein YidH (DUF202 family)